MQQLILQGQLPARLPGIGLPGVGAVVIAGIAQVMAALRDAADLSRGVVHIICAVDGAVIAQV